MARIQIPTGLCLSTFACQTRSCHSLWVVGRTWLCSHRNSRAQWPTDAGSTTSTSRARAHCISSRDRIWRKLSLEPGCLEHAARTTEATDARDIRVKSSNYFFAKTVKKLTSLHWWNRKKITIFETLFFNVYYFSLHLGTTSYTSVSKCCKE